MAIDVRGTTQVVGVWGWPVRHSASPPMHNAAFAALGLDYIYVPFAVNPEHIGAAVDAVRALDLRGVNITVPLKEKVPPFLDALTPRAERLGAVNTIINDNGFLTGDSTDGRGFLQALAEAGATPETGKRALILGAGGSARAVVDALRETGIAVTIANRTLERGQEVAERLGKGKGPEISVISLDEESLRRELSDPNLTHLVNTTSVGMHPMEGEMPPVPADALHSGLFVSDLIYNPPQTRLLSEAKSRGCQIQNGLSMLVWQGALSFSAWTGVQELPIEEMREAVTQALNLR